MNPKEMLDERRKRHTENVRAAFEAAKAGAVINLSALMCGAEQTGAEAFGGAATVDNSEPLRSDDWRTETSKR